MLSQTLAALALLGWIAQAPADEHDYTKVSPDKLGIASVAARKDGRTGFVVGGKNETSLVRKLTELNGRGIAGLEKEMRPGAASMAGFLGKDEALLDVLASDNDFVLDRGLTHQELARHLHVIGAIGTQANGPVTFRYHGRRFKVEIMRWRGYQHSPFDDGTKTNADATLTNLTTNKQLKYSLLVPHMIERYGFYEGRGTPYRVDPGQILTVLDFLVKKGPK